MLLRTTIPLVDREGRIVAILAGHPDDPNWVVLHLHAADCLEEARKQGGEERKKCSARRGEFKTMRCGVSHGGGQTQPRNLSNTPKDEKILSWLNGEGVFNRFAGFASCR